MMVHKIAGIAFDAYGTLFDVYSVAAKAEEIFPGFGARIAEVWRVAQIDYTRLRTLCDQYKDFRYVTEDALRFAVAKLDLVINTQQIHQLMDAYARLDAFDENLSVLSALKARGIPLAILSNGTSQMLDSAVESAGMEGIFDHILSVERVRKFKTAPEAYQLGPDAFGAKAGNIVFVSSNGWDVCGATWFGYHSFWVNRAGNVLEQLGVMPHGEGRNLGDLIGFIDSLHAK